MSKELKVKVRAGVTHTLISRDSYLVSHRRRAAAQVYDKDLGRDDVLGELQYDLCKLKMGHGPKDIEKTVRRGVRFPSTRRHH